MQNPKIEAPKSSTRPLTPISDPYFGVIFDSSKILALDFSFKLLKRIKKATSWPTDFQNEKKQT